MKIVVNKCYGGFSLSLKGQKRLAELEGKELYFYKQTKYNFQNGIDEYIKIKDLNERSLFIYPITKDLGNKINEIPNDCWFNSRDEERDNPLLIQVVEELGEEANGDCARLQIVEIPDDVEWEIEEYDGMEWVSEKHRTW